MPATANVRRYRFGGMMLDAGQRRLTRGRDPVRISTLTFDFLLALVESWPNVVSYEELLERVWRGRCVSHETVSQRVLMLRKVLSDDAERPRYVEVIRGHGCRLIPAVHALEPRWALHRRARGIAFAGGLAAVALAMGYWTYSSSSLAPPAPTPDDRLEALPTGNSEVRALYRGALDFWRQSGTSSLRSGNVDPIIHAYLDRVIDLAPGFAMAYGLKARAYADSLITPLPARDDVVRVRAEQERLAWLNINEALTRDYDTSLAHLAMAKVHQHNFRWVDARVAYSRALDADPKHVGVLNAAALFHAYLGEHARALNLARQAVEVDRNQPVSLFHLGVVHAFSRNYDLAVDALRGAVELNPGYASARVWLAHMQRLRGDTAAAATALDAAQPIILQRHPPRLLNLAAGYAQLGKNDEARRLIELFVDAGDEWQFGAVPRALAHVILGEKQAALDALRAALEQREPDDGFILEMMVKANVFRHETLDEPEFLEIRRRLGSRG